MQNNRIIFIGPMLIKNKGWEFVLKRLQLSANDKIVAIDGGVIGAKKFKLPIAHAFGDWDGTSSPENIPHTTFSRKKDQSDLACVLDILSENRYTKNIQEWVFVGFSGGRLDHHLGVLYDLKNFCKTKKILMLSPEMNYYFVSPKISFPQAFDSGLVWLQKKQTLSVFALENKTQGVCLRGLKYNLNAQTLELTTRGLSNEVKQPKSVSISTQKGVLLVMVLSGGRVY